MKHLEHYQHHFISSLNGTVDDGILSSIQTVSGSSTEAQTRFSVYRNNYIHGLLQVMKDSYPVLVRLVGESFFNSLAKEFVTQNPPHQAAMLEYGKTFDRFLKHHDGCKHYPYLADVASLEFHYIQCFNGPDSESINVNHLLAVSEEDLPDVRLIKHPNYYLLSSTYPVLDIWYANLDDEVSEINIDELAASQFLMYRNDQQRVETIQLQNSAFQFCQQLIAGDSIEEAWQHINQHQDQPLEEQELYGLINYFLGLGVFTDLTLSRDNNHEKHRPNY